jgi:GNAT superfamily N-acetyltransferase
VGAHFFIRAARIDDAAAMAQVIVDTGRSAHRGQIPDAVLFEQPLAEAYAESEQSWQRTLDEIAHDRHGDNCVYVAVNDDDVPVGVIMAGPPREGVTLPHCAEVYVLYVRGAFQGRGLGRRLLHAVAERVDEQGWRALTVGCLAANLPARGFYEALGAHLIGERVYEQSAFSAAELVYGWRDLAALIEQGNT